MTLPSDNNRPIDASVVLGANTNTGKDVTITDEERLRGISIIGTTGTGKSTLLKSLALQAIEKSECVVLITFEPDKHTYHLCGWERRREKISSLLCKSAS